MPFSQTIQHLIAGTMGGLVSTVSLYPLELVKTRMQVIDDKAVYRSFTQAVRSIVQSEGVVGLYSGLVPAVVASSGSWGGYFFFYESSKRRKLSHKPQGLNTVDHLLSGVEAGSILVLMFNPLWVVKTRLALQDAESGSHAHYRGLVHALQTIFREEGLPGLYRGLIPALLLTSHGAIQFATYESMKAGYERIQLKTNEPHQQPAWVSLAMGGISKIVASTLTYPYQVVKSRLQQRGSRYRSTWHCTQEVWKTEGSRAFFRGMLPNALRVAPSAAITFVVYEECIKLLKSGSGKVSNVELVAEVSPVEE
eukprot:gene8501-9371_t